MPLAAGDRLGPYQILDPIGSGGMGEVWKARDMRLGRIVAIKLLKDQHSERFEQEACAVAALNHPNICQIYDTGPDYLVLEHVDGKPLQGPFPVQEAVRLAIQIASALEEAHGRGILHRDLKPDNILVTTKGAAKLLDFGLAKFLAADSDFTKTVEGTVMGTAAYMAPEQAQGKPLDERSDIFSFGAVLYEMVSGKRAFSGVSVAEVMSAVLRDEPERLMNSAALSAIVMRCLRKTPGERFQTMEEIKVALETISEKRVGVQPSIAVLPFANMSRGADDEYFSDGLAEEIINALTQVAGLKVIARTSAFAFKGKNEDIRRIAEALGVTSVLEGSVRRAGNHLRVTAQLIHAADGTHLWSQRYDREMTDVFAVQDEIAAAITGTLQVKLTGRPVTARTFEPNLPAYEAFLRGRQQSYKLSPEAHALAEEHFKRAIALDPQWADPHSYLGRVYFSLGFYGLRPSTEMVAVARAEARKALELLPFEPIAHALLGIIAASYDYDWKEAEEQFRLAKASEPLPPYVHDMRAHFYLLPLGRFEEALQERMKAIAQDPLNALWHAHQAFTFLCAEMYELAVVEARKALELDDRIYVPQWVIALSYFFQGKRVHAQESAEEAFRLAPWSVAIVGTLAGLLARAGEKDRAEKLLATIPLAGPVGMYLYHLLCSEIDAATDCYAQGIEQRNLRAMVIASAGFLKPLRASPRWPKLARMMNLPGTM
jgi:TolB-like protein/tetratricopeptide (TPR) repeat protein/predicted Ser/Thr protein kinase